MVYFQTKNVHLDKFWRALEWKMLVDFIGIFYGHLVQLKDVWYSLRSFGIFFPIWCVWTKKNLSTLLLTTGHEMESGQGISFFRNKKVRTN
jgi:hypothetical protein